MTKTSVALLMGGTSAKRDVLLASGRECARALREAGYSVQEIDPGPDLPAVLARMSPDVVFNALHGRGGEYGHVQGLLGFMGLPHTHSGVLGSTLAMYKQRSKEFFGPAGCRS